MHDNILNLFHGYAARHFTSESVVLEVGPVWPRVLTAPCARWDTTDIRPDPRNTSRCTEYWIPSGDETYDIVLSANVLEHVRKPWVWVRELRRVCKTGGLVITLTPCNWPYHEDPVDCWRAYPEGLKALYEDAGLEIVECVARYGETVSELERAWFPEGKLTIDAVAVGRKA